MVAAPGIVPLGESGLRVSRLGIGLAALGRPGYITLGHASDLGSSHRREEMEAHAHAVLDAAHDGGVRYFDAARSYGMAEDFLGSWIASRGVAAGAVTVGSKWGYTYTAQWRVDAATHEVKDHSLAVLRRQYAESRARLGDHLALYQIHSATPESGVLEDAAVLDELARLRDEGLRIGFTASGPAQPDTIRRALEVHRGGARVFQTVQATWNLLERAAGPALRDAHDAGLGVIVKEALANGRLTTRNDDPAFAAQRALLEREAERLETTVDALALAAVLAERWAHVVLSGAATVDQLRSNLGACAVQWSTDLRERLDALSMDTHEYWRERGALRWN